MLTACGSSEKKTAEGENPFFTEYTTPFGVPPFDQIKFEHYKPAMLKGMEEGRKEIEAIVNNPEEPTFENTIVAFSALTFFSLYLALRQLLSTVLQIFATI